MEQGVTMTNIHSKEQYNIPDTHLVACSFCGTLETVLYHGKEGKAFICKGCIYIGIQINKQE